MDLEAIIRVVADGDKDLLETIRRFAYEVLEDEGRDEAYGFVLAFTNAKVRAMFYDPFKEGIYGV